AALPEPAAKRWLRAHALSSHDDFVGLRPHDLFRRSLLQHEWRQRPSALNTYEHKHTSDAGWSRPGQIAETCSAARARSDGRPAALERAADAAWSDIRPGAIG